jgi:hypothetical protein
VAGIFIVPAEKAQDVRWEEVNWVSLLSRHPFSQYYSPTGSTWLMYGGGNSPSTRLRATYVSNILWCTTKVNEACAPMTKVRLSTNIVAHTEL